MLDTAAYEVTYCNYCSSPISFSPLEDVSTTRNFCDIICAKLYHDNIGNISIDSAYYNSLCVRKRLSHDAEQYWLQYGDVFFDMLPRYDAKEVDAKEVDATGIEQRQAAKEKYISVIRHIL
jgi:hypothetical protein